jgi:hypothetical protein
MISLLQTEDNIKLDTLKRDIKKYLKLCKICGFHSGDIQDGIFWVVKPCSVAVGYRHNQDNLDLNG